MTDPSKTNKIAQKPNKGEIQKIINFDLLEVKDKK